MSERKPDPMMPRAAQVMAQLRIFLLVAVCVGGGLTARGVPAEQRDRGAAPCLVALADAAPTASAKGGAACSAARPFTGEPAETPRQMDSQFMMVSAYNLEPYSREYLENVLSDLARHRVNGIVYGTLGQITSVMRSKGLSLDEATLNKSIYEMAHDYGTGLWLQIRVYDNEISIGGSAPRNYTAEELLEAPGGKEAFASGVRKEFVAYNNYFKANCRVIMFEEAGTYHATNGGGMFWSGRDVPRLRPNRASDDTFAARFAGLFEIAKQTIKSINPSCPVGAHLGHSAVMDKPVLQQWIARMASEQAAPDFIFYDFYLKSQPDFSAYASKLEDRANFIIHTLGLPALQLAQLHTMNNFQRGLGATPSRSEIDDIVALDERLGFTGIGFYSKNAAATARFDNGPMAPNAVGQTTVYDTSKDRWDYGLLKVFETEGVNFRNFFDLVVRSLGSSPVEISARNISTGAWDLIGVTPASGAAGTPGQSVTVFRALDAHRYLDGMRKLTLRFAVFTGDRPAVAGKQNETVWVAPSEPARSFRSVESVQAELASADRPRDIRGTGSVQIDANSQTMTLCMQ